MILCTSISGSDHITMRIIKLQKMAHGIELSVDGSCEARSSDLWVHGSGIN